MPLLFVFEKLNSIMITVSLRSFTLRFINFIYCALYSFSSFWFYLYLILINFLWQSDLSITFFTIYYSNISSTLLYSSSKDSSLFFSYFTLFPLLFDEWLKKDVFVSLIMDKLKGFITKLEDMLMLLLLIVFFYAFEMTRSLRREIGREISICRTS